jgi:hypothetical protein
MEQTHYICDACRKDVGAKSRLYEVSIPEFRYRYKLGYREGTKLSLCKKCTRKVDIFVKLISKKGKGYGK